MMGPTSYAGSETTWTATAPGLWTPVDGRSRFGDIVLVIFLLAQCFDGVFTYIGIVSFGTGIEANPLISSLIGHLGEANALLAAKLFAGMLGIALHIRQVHSAVAALAVFYLGAAILPWASLLFLSGL
jgi:uncharacterized membrane protein